MSSLEAEAMDPQVRLLLLTVSEAFAAGGLFFKDQSTSTACIIGRTSHEYLPYATLHSGQTNTGKFTNTGTNACMAANRLSFNFDFTGNSMVIDTACSSSLCLGRRFCTQVRCRCFQTAWIRMALAISVDELQQKSCSKAVCGGANLCLTPITTIGFCQGGFLSKEGRCKSFDEDADGYARAEAAGVAILSRISDAEKAHRQVLACMRDRGARVNNGRSGVSIAAPAFDQLQLMIAEALTRAGMSKFEFDYVECHGTGTKEGDATEGNAVAKVLGAATGGRKDGPLLLGSIKSNMGHSEGASGIVGVFNLAMMLHHQTILPLCPAAHKQKTSRINWDEACILPSTCCYQKWHKQSLAGGVSHLIQHWCLSDFYHSRCKNS